MDKQSLVGLVLKQGKLIKDLEKRIEKLEREQHRQAAPFRIPESRKVKSAKVPGQKRGHVGHHRKFPSHVDDFVKVPLCCCPKCGGGLERVVPVVQYIEEIPCFSPHVTKLTTYRGSCRHCGQVSSSHPLKTSNATGAAKVQVGPNAKSIATRLQYEYGLTKRKTSKILGQMFGLSYSPGGLVHCAHKLGEKCETDYQQLMDKVKSSAYIHSDETSWYVGKPKYWLWVFANQGLTLYKVSDKRNKELLGQILGDNYHGALVSDCLNIYDGFNPVQQKCYSHHLKAVNQAIEKQTGQQQGSLLGLKGLLLSAMELKKDKPGLSKKAYKASCKKLEEEADVLLANSRDDPVEEKVVNRIRKQRDHLFTFLYIDQVDATNNLAERQLRPAVISRKVSCGNKTDRGAHTWEILTSLITTNNMNNNDVQRFFTDKAVFRN